MCYLSYFESDLSVEPPQQPQDEDYQEEDGPSTLQDEADRAAGSWTNHLEAGSSTNHLEAGASTKNQTDLESGSSTKNQTDLAAGASTKNQTDLAAGTSTNQNDEASESTNKTDEASASTNKTDEASASTIPEEKSTARKNLILLTMKDIYKSILDSPLPKHTPVEAPSEETPSSKRKRCEEEMISNKREKMERDIYDNISAIRYMLMGTNTPPFIENTVGTELMSEMFRFFQWLNIHMFSEQPPLAFYEINYPDVIAQNENGFKPKLMAREWINACNELLQWKNNNSNDILQHYNVWLYINTMDVNLGYVYIHKDKNPLEYKMGFVFGCEYLKTISGLSVSQVRAIRQLFFNYFMSLRNYNIRDSFRFADQSVM